MNDGGPAFPVPNDANVNQQEGMSLRDYFAASIVQGMFAADTEAWYIKNENFDETAVRAYVMADSMLKAREV